MSELVKLRRTTPLCGYEQWCDCATWVPDEGWVLDMELQRRAKKRRNKERQ